MGTVDQRELRYWYPRRRHDGEPEWLPQMTGVLKPLVERANERGSLRDKENEVEREGGGNLHVGHCGGTGTYRDAGR